ncbi:MAG: hypothetical protein LBU65_07080 [Planctomycetaceae bacterium]|nr:hypothetical protein [Planctomycetaceae bacterium]
MYCYDNAGREGATVELILSEGQAKYKAVTITDSQGIAVMSTYGSAGVPLGKYKVVVSKKVEDNFIYGESSTGTKEVIAVHHIALSNRCIQTQKPRRTKSKSAAKR